MANGGYLIRFDGKDKDRCYSCKFDYDECYYEINDKTQKPLPPKLKKIEIIIETE